MRKNEESRPLSHVDAAWLRMDSPVNPMVITTALTLEGQVPFEAIARVTEERFLAHERFHLRVVDAQRPLLAPRWEPDPQFDLRSHLHHLRVPAPGDEAAFAAVVSDLMSTRLDPTRPLWQTYVFDDAPGGTAIVSRFHHCLADGMALMRVLLGVCDGAGDEPLTEPGLRRPPTELNVRALAAKTASYATTCGRLLLLPSDPPTILRGALGPRKRAARAEALPLPTLKAKAKQLGGSLHDLLATLVTGALHRYLREQGVRTEGLTLRALVPMFLRDRDDTGLGNHFGLVFLDLPVGLSDRAQRFQTVKEHMDRLKAQDDAVVAFAVLDAVGIASSELEHIALEVFSRKASLLLSDVPGIEAPMRIAGYPLNDVSVWAPVSGYLGVGITAVSYAERLRLSVYSDARLLADPRELAYALDAEAACYL
ncbi:MAG TPA: wax ester/triacylglycerol synthase domain-containing protein [Polyangiaceae bacterium]|nr:wax ester/triacylglycerol synthase domain-containing protein [Polyangiaceae bacterium]